MRALAPGKVNLCLYLGPTRPDGRHELVTVLESVSLADEVVLDVASVDSVHCPGVPGRNLAEDALAALRAAGWQGPPVAIEIRKRVPVAAGMGGGSADAAAVLRLAAELAPVPGDLHELAARLGSDVPSQLEPGLYLGTGAGEIVEPFAPLPPRAFVIVPLTGCALATADVYAEADRLRLARPAVELERVAAELRSGAAPSLVNDLQEAALSLCPAIGDALAALRDAGADGAFVCGSGPTCVGLWWEPVEAAAAVDAVAGSFAGATIVHPVASGS